MKLFDNVQVEDEIEFIDFRGNKVLALVHYADDRLFRVKNLEYQSWNNSWRDAVYSFYLSGKPTNRNYNYGPATRLVNRWSQIQVVN